MSMTYMNSLLVYCCMITCWQTFFHEFKLIICVVNFCNACWMFKKVTWFWPVQFVKLFIITWIALALIFNLFHQSIKLTSSLCIVYCWIARWILFKKIFKKCLIPVYGIPRNLVCTRARLTDGDISSTSGKLCSRETNSSSWLK